MSSVPENPFVSPQEDTKPASSPTREQARSQRPEPAPLDRQKISNVVDGLLGFGACYYLGSFVGAFFARMNNTPETRWQFLSSPLFWLSLVGVLVLYSLAYSLLTEWLTGRSIGNLLTYTKVVGEDGNAPSIGQIMKRALARYVPAGTPKATDSDIRFWHDRVSSTVVVSCGKKRVEEDTFFQ